MANTFYPKGAQKVISAQINFNTDTIKAVLLPTGYTYRAAHEFLSEAGVAVGVAQELTGKTTTGGVFDANDLDFGALAAGSTVKALVIYKDTGNPATSPLLLYIDQVTGMPFVTNGGALSVPWSDGALKIFSMIAP